MNPGVVLVLILALGALVAGTRLTSYAAVRVARQPIDVDPTAETRLLDAIECDTGAYVRCASVLTSSDFTGTRQARYETIVERYRESGVEPAPEGTSDSDAAERVEQARSLVVGETLPESSYLADGERVLSLGASRALTTERNIVVSTGNDAAPLERRVWEPPRQRGMLVSLACFAGIAAGGLAAARVAPEDTIGVQALSALCVAVLVAGGVVLALVDIDAYVIDMFIFGIWLSASVALAAGAVVAGGAPERLWGGIGAFVVVALYEGISYTMGKLRGVTQGFGDTLLALGTAGVPGLLTGRWEAAVVSAVAAGIASIIWFAIQAARGKANRQTPIPYAPFLVVGAVVALCTGAFL